MDSWIHRNAIRSRNAGTDAEQRQTPAGPTKTPLKMPPGAVRVRECRWCGAPTVVTLDAIKRLVEKFGSGYRADLHPAG